MYLVKNKKIIEKNEIFNFEGLTHQEEAMRNVQIQEVLNIHQKNVMLEIE